MMQVKMAKKKVSFFLKQLFKILKSEMAKKKVSFFPEKSYFNDKW